MVLALVNRKGGVGKTTLAVNIAACLARQGQAVLLVDAEAAPPFQVISLRRSNLGPDVAQLSRNFGWTLLDSPPAGAEIARACIAAADQVLLPVEPSALSAWAADLTVEQVQAAQSFKPDLQAWFVVTRKIPGTVIGREMRHLIAQTGIPVLATEITNRVAFMPAWAIRLWSMSMAGTSTPPRLRPAVSFLAVGAAGNHLQGHGPQEEFVARLQREGLR